MKEEADSNITLLKENYAQLETTHNTQVTELEQAIAKCTKERDNLKEEVAELTATLNQTRFAHQQEMTRLQENLVEEKERVGKVEEERKQAKEELTSMHGMVAEETESLRFQLSTANMQLQKTTKVMDREISIVLYYSLHTYLIKHYLTRSVYTVRYYCDIWSLFYKCGTVKPVYSGHLGTQ